MILFKDFGELVGLVNTRLGDFCNEFGNKRKELASLGKSPRRGILFIYDETKGKEWAINEGGGKEVQYHLALDDSNLMLRYGIGFNTQYVPFVNDKPMVEYVQPFMNGFLKNEIEIRNILSDYDFVHGDLDQLKYPENDQYVLFGKIRPIEYKDDAYCVEDTVLDEIVMDLKKQFKPYKIIFEERNSSNKIEMSIQDSMHVLIQKKQIILQGPPGTGKTFTAKDIAEQIIFSKVSEDKRKQKELLEKSDQFRLIQFHPAYSYEDFVRGIIAKTKDKFIEYVTENKVLTIFANDAYKNWKDAGEPKEKVAKETWVTKTLEFFKEYLIEEIERDGKVMLTNKAYIHRVTDTSIRYNSDVWEVDGGVPLSDIVKMYLADNKTRQQIQDNTELTKTAKSLSTYWLKVLELFKKFIADNKLKPEENFATIEEKKYVLIIDEINRANLPAVLGELIYALEYRGEPVGSMYPMEDNSAIIIPPNLFIIGTMNTADRSVGHIDYAIRRRFAFIDVLPKVIQNENFDLSLFKRVSELFIKNVDEYIVDSSSELVISDYLSEEFRPQDVWLGHSYFIMDGNNNDLRKKFEIIPILKEYVKDGVLKQTAEKFINSL